MAVYFDYAAATPMDPRVLRAMEPFFSDNFYNPSALYDASRQLKKTLKQARNDVAQIVGSKDSEIIFTAGASEANNLAISGVMRKHRGCNLVVSSIEHESVLATAKNYNHKIAPVDAKGMVDLSKLAELIDDKTVLISIMQANNEIGTIQPIKQIAELIAELRMIRLKNNNKTPLYLHTDAAQGCNYLDIHVSRLGVDLMSINGGKIYGPKQSGFLYVKTGVDLEPFIYGGGQERGLRSGTENIPAIIGLATALKITDKIKKTEAERLKKLQNLFLDELGKADLDYCVNGSVKHRLPNNLNLSFAGHDNERLMILLDQKGYMVATGSACSASNQEPSHVLSAIGLDRITIDGSLRITFGRQTTDQDVANLVLALVDIIKQS